MVGTLRFAYPTKCSLSSPLGRDLVVRHVLVDSDIAGQAEHALGDDVAQDLVGAARGEELARLAARTGTWADPLLRDKLLAHVVEEKVLQMTTVRAFVETGTGPVGAEGSIRKLISSWLQEQAGVLAAEADPVGVLGRPAGSPLNSSAYDFLSMKQTSIAGGTSEIQRNIIAERVLGLPRR